jgi:hypothetical protein
LAIQRLEMGDVEIGDEAELEVASDQIDEVVQQINGICRSTSLEFALRVGSVIIHRFYGGNARGWRDRGPKVHSFRRLAAHPDLALSAGALYRCVAIFEMCDRLHAPSRWRRLGASHLRAVIGVPREQQEHLLTRANEERWSVQVLQMRAQNLRCDRGRGGRRPTSQLDKHLRSMDRCLQDWNRAIESVGSSGPRDLEQALQLVTRTKAFVDKLTGELLVGRRHRLEMGGPDPL